MDGGNNGIRAVLLNTRRRNIKLILVLYLKISF